MMIHNEKITDFLINEGVNLVGFADISVLSDSQTKGYPYGIAFGIALNPAIVKNILTGPHLEYYYHYVDVSDKLNSLSYRLSDYISTLGYRAYPQSRENVKQNEKYCTVLPHKTICTLSGLGWIGKSALLINKIYGGAVRYYTVLTDIPVQTGDPITESKCGDCKICHKYCPGKAINIINWDITTIRDDLLNAYLCKKSKIERGKKIGNKEDGSCGMCIAVCPYTQAYINRST